MPLPELKTLDVAGALAAGQTNALRAMQLQQLMQEEHDKNALRALVAGVVAKGGDPMEQRRAVADAYIRTGKPEYVKAGADMLKTLDEGPFSKVDPKDYTPESLISFARTRRYEDLVPRVKMELTNLGGNTVAYNPFNIPAGSVLPHTLTPGEEATLGWDKYKFANLSANQQQELENQLVGLRIRQGNLDVARGNLGVNQGNLGVNRQRLWYETGLGANALGGNMTMGGTGLRGPGGVVAPSQPATGLDLPPKARNDAMAAFTKEQLDAMVKNYTENMPKFVGGINAINQARDALGGGMYAGKFADFKLQTAKMLKAAVPDALVPADFDKKIANTETYSAATGQLVLNIIKNLGSGSGISDADREYAAKIVGGQISLDEQSMPRLLDIAERGIRGQASLHNANVDAAAAKGFAPLGNIKFDLPGPRGKETAAEISKTINGVTYVKRGGQWFKK